MSGIFLIILTVIGISFPITVELKDADTKIYRNVDTVIYRLSNWENLSPMISNLVVSDMNHDGINDLIYSEDRHAEIAAPLGFIRVFFGEKQMDSLLLEDSSEITIVDSCTDTIPGSAPIYDFSIDLVYSGLVRNSEGNFLLVAQRVGCYRCMFIPITFSLIPSDLMTGYYSYEDVIHRIFYVPPLPPSAPLCTNTLEFFNCEIYDTFFVLPAHSLRMDSTDTIKELYMFLPINILGDSVNVLSDCSFSIKIFHEYDPYCLHSIFNIGDVDGDGKDELFLARQMGTQFTAGLRISSSGYPRFDPHILPPPEFFRRVKSYLIFGNTLGRHMDLSINSDSLLPSYFYNVYINSFDNTYSSLPEKPCDLNGDGFNDIVVIEANRATLLGGGPYCHTWPEVWHPDILADAGDTARLFIIFGRYDFPHYIINSFSSCADKVIKSDYTSAGIGSAISTGDYNGDGYDDILVGATSVRTTVGYIFLGNPSGDYPINFNNADILIKADSQYTYGYTHDARCLLYLTSARLGDLNDDGLDDIILAFYKYQFKNPTARFFDFPFVYIFFNRRPTPSLFHPDTNIFDNPHDSICIKLSFKQPLALHTLLLTVSGDTFTIDSPQVRFSPAESLLCFIPDTEWDTSTIIPFCIERLEDTIGTAMRERWCVRFNDSTWNVCQPPKPRTLSLKCYPNPFNAEVRIKLRMPDAGDVKIDIYDISGKLIDHIHKTKLTAGWHELVWRPRISVPSGVYLLRVSAGGEAVVRRVVLVR